MIETLYGRIIETDSSSCSIIIECGGVGFHVGVTGTTLGRLPEIKYSPDGEEIPSDPVRIYTHMAVREDAMELYGFATRDELGMFRLLIGVNGIGPKAAMSILSLLTPAKLAFAVETGDEKAISKAPGVGAKTAARVTLELKGKIEKNFPELLKATDGGQEIAAKPAPAKKDTELADAREVLISLGYSRSEIAAAMKSVDTEAEAGEIIRQALAVLSM